MTYKKSITILLPGYGWEDFPLDEAPDRSCAYVTMAAVAYHPAVVHAFGKGAEWEGAQVPPQLEDDLRDGLFLVGTEFRHEIEEDWIARAEAVGAEILNVDANATVETLLDAILSRVEPAAVRTFSSDWVADLLAVGFALFQVELITRQIQYLSSLDLCSVNNEVCRIVRSLAEGDEAAARQRLEKVYDRFLESREYQYPVENYLFDMTLVAPTTLGESLAKELAEQVAPINLLMTGELVERHPATVALLAERCKRADETPDEEMADDDVAEALRPEVTVLGGPWAEMPCPLMNHESILADLLRGFDAYRKHLGMTPTVYARRLSGFTPMLPQVLRGLGMTGAVHIGLDGKSLPQESQSRIRWKGHGGHTIEAIGGKPIDAADPGGFLVLPERLGEVLDMDESPTVALVHWPNRSNTWHGYLRHIARRSGLLGRAMVADRYFDETIGVESEAYTADRYESCFLRDFARDFSQETSRYGSRDPISRWVRYHARLLRFQSIRTISILTELAGVSTVACSLGRETLDRINDLVLQPDERQEQELDAQLAERLKQLTELFASGVAGKESQKGTLWINPTSMTRSDNPQTSLAARACPALEPLQSAGQALAANGRTAKFSCQGNNPNTPGFGFTWAGSELDESSVAESESQSKPKRSFFSRFQKPTEVPPLAEGNVLRNEFFEVTLDTATGAIRAVHDYHTRGNRFGQQIALRMADVKDVVDEARGFCQFWTEESEELLYTTMVADSQEVLSAGPQVGRIVSRGRLVDRYGKNMADFSQTVEIERGSRTLGLEIELEPHHRPSGDPWEAYYAARFAWRDSTTELYRSVGLVSERCDVDRIESPYFVDLRTDKTRTTILPQGLPFHRRFGFRKLDTLLAVQGETARRFRLGIAIDSPSPTQAALAEMMPILSVDEVLCPSVPTGWLLHLDRPNVVATDFEPIHEAGKLVGMIVRLLEVEGAETTLRLQACRPIDTAEVTDFLGITLEKLAPKDQTVEVALAAREWKQLRLRWKS